MFTELMILSTLFLELPLAVLLFFPFCLVAMAYCGFSVRRAGWGPVWNTLIWVAFAVVLAVGWGFSRLDKPEDLGAFTAACAHVWGFVSLSGILAFIGGYSTIGLIYSFLAARLHFQKACEAVEEQYKLRGRKGVSAYDLSYSLSSLPEAYGIKVTFHNGVEFPPEYDLDTKEMASAVAYWTYNWPGCLLSNLLNDVLDRIAQRVARSLRGVYKYLLDSAKASVRSV